VYNTIEPPALVVHHGTATLVFTPASIANGLAEAAEFAAALAQVASERESDFRRALAQAPSEGPFDIEALVAEHGPPQHSDGEPA
jgi:hypothetical protein